MVWSVPRVDRDEVLSMSASGISRNLIALHFGCARSTISRILSIVWPNINIGGQAVKVKQIRLDKTLRTYLRDNQINQNQLSKKIGIGPSSLHSYINGIVPRGLETLVNMAYELNLSLDELVFNQSLTSVSQKMVVSESNILGLLGKYELVISKKAEG